MLVFRKNPFMWLILPRLLPVRQAPKLFWFVLSFPKLGSWLMYSKLSCKLNPERGWKGEREEEKNVKRRIKLFSNRLSNIDNLSMTQTFPDKWIESHIYQRKLHFRGICWRKRQKLFEDIHPIKLNGFTSHNGTWTPWILIQRLTPRILLFISKVCS